MIKLNLDGAWAMFSEDGARHSAEIPGTVLSTLLADGSIPDPFDGMNEGAACAETEKTWHFEKTFDVSAEALAEPRADLVFEGLDTLADITLNGKLLRRTDNMHRTWRIPAREYLHVGKNTLRITFGNAMEYVRKAAEEHPEITYTGGSELLWTGSIRKAHYMFGWDWGPRLPDAGIWRPARLEFYSSRLEEIRIRGHLVPDEIEQGGLYAAETVVQAGDVGLGEGESRRVALGGETVDHGAARIAQAEHLGALVEGFAHGVVDGLAEDGEGKRRIDPHYLGVASRHQQAQIREGRFVDGLAFLTDEIGEDMALEMVDHHDGLAEGKSEGLCEGCPDKERAQKARTAGESYGVQIFRTDACKVERTAHDRHDILLMGP